MCRVGEVGLRYRQQRGAPPDLPRTLGVVMGIASVLILAAIATLTIDRWPNVLAQFEPHVVVQTDSRGRPEVVIRRDREGQYIVPGTINGVKAEFLIDTGATDVAVPHTLAQQLGLRRGPSVEIVTASDVIPGYLVTLKEVSIGPLSVHRVKGSVSKHAIGDEVLLGMTFLRHFDISQGGRNLTIRARRQ